MLEVFAPRRIRVPNLRLQPRHRLCGSSGRYSARFRKLTPTEESAIHALAATTTLRSLAAEFGVSHETIRTVLWQERSA